MCNYLDRKLANGTLNLDLRVPPSWQVLDPRVRWYRLGDTWIRMDTNEFQNALPPEIL